MLPDIAKITEIFLVPSAVLVGAIGVASTEPLKTGISFLGLVSSAIWAVCSWDVFRPVNIHPTLREAALGWLPALFVSVWLVSLIVHGFAWSKQRKKPISN
jgi:hypothetical protein